VDQRQPPARATVTFDDLDLVRQLYGDRDQHLKRVAREVGVDIHARGNTVTLSGAPAATAQAERILAELYAVLERGYPLGPNDVEYAVRIASSPDAPPLAEVFLDTVVVSARRRPITPKSAAQKAYVDAIRGHDLVFGVGPAGTGKTYLAMAMGVAALLKKEVTRIILTRPAVEAGEKLGFLPGTLEEKVNPYLRPLYDALHDLLEYEKVAKWMERGVIEVSPLAFMRGRAQPVDTPVLAPGGWRAIGSLEVGDEVIGSDGRPTRVLGVYPQGRKEVFRVRMSDGASTRCCGEHLWSVYTPEDRRRGRPARVLETRDVAGRLRRAHQHRFELPLLSAPVAFPARPVPIEPYALGLLLGDGCLSGRTPPSVTTADGEIAYALEDRREPLGVALARKTDIDYVLRRSHPATPRVAGAPGVWRGGRTEHPLSAALRHLGLWGVRSGTKFVPDCYLYNSPQVRLALLQGLLDTDGGPVRQAGRTCRVQYCTTSARLRDDVVFLVRSLGGVAYCRTRRAEGRKPGRARGRDVAYRSDAYVLDIRLPAAAPPFRLSRKWEAHAESGGGRPMRFVDRVEPAGMEDTVCIRVGAADALYVTEDFILTHNTLNDSFVILDEAQNTTSEQMKMFLTRLGFSSKAVVTGDITQIDLPAGTRSGLVEAIRLLRGVPGIAITTFSEKDVVRHRLVQAIIRAYERGVAPHDHDDAEETAEPRESLAGPAGDEAALAEPSR
jgi:phosphate starvation-inducible PhoH-like protein